MNETKKDKSVGVIPVYYNIAGQRQFLLVLHNLGHWSWPKGHPEPGESELETAKRELFEETGIRLAEIDQSKEFVENYSFVKDGVNYDKTVKYFIGRVADLEVETPALFREEVLALEWLPYDLALKKLTFPEARNVLQAVEGYLKTSDEGGN